MSLEVAILETAYRGSVADLERAGAKADSIFKKNVKEAQKAEKEISQAYSRAGSAAQNLLGRLPGGQRLSGIGQTLGDLKGLTSGLGEAEAAAGGMGGEVGVLAGAGGPLALLGVGLVGGAVAAGVFIEKAFELTRWASDYASHLVDLSQRTGIAVQDLSVWKAAVETSGGSLDAVNTALGQYIRKVADANHGTKQAAKDYKQIGIDAKAAYESPQAAISLLVARTNQLSNEEDRLLLLRKAGVRNAEQVNSAIKEMGGTYEEFRAKVERLGLIITPEQAQAADKFGDTLKYVEMQMAALAFQAGSKFFPTFQKGMEDLQGEFGRLGPLVENMATVANVALSVLLESLRQYVAEAKALLEIMAGADPGLRWLLERHPQTPQGTQTVDYGNSVAVDPKTMRPFPGLGDKENKGKSGESAARKAAKQALELARIDIAEAESIYREGVDIARRAYDLNLNDFNDYVQRRKDAEKERYDAVVKGFEAERRAASTLPAAGERTVELKKIRQHERDELRKHNETNAQLETEGLQHRAQIEKEFAELSVQFQQETNRVLELDLADQMERGTTTAVRAWERRTAALGEEALKQGDVLQKALVNALGGADNPAAKKLSDTINETMQNAIDAGSVGELSEQFKTIMSEAANPEAVRRALGQIQLFFIRRRQILKEGNKDGQAAQEEDLRRRQDYANRLAEINDSILDSQIEVAQLSADAIARHSFSRDAVIDAGRALDIARETARHAREIRELEQRKERDALLEDKKKSAELIAGIGREIEAAESAHQARLADIDAKAADERKEQFREIVSDISDIYGTFLDHLGGDWSDTWHDMLNVARRILIQIAQELFKISFTHEASNAGGIVGWAANALGQRLFGGPSLPTSGVTQGGILGSLPASPNVRGFASGGSFLVGGNGGIDTTRVSFMATRGEEVSVRTPEQQRTQQPASVLVAFGDREIQRAHEAALASSRGRRVQRVNARYLRKVGR